MNPHTPNPADGSLTSLKGCRVILAWPETHAEIRTLLAAAAPALRRLLVVNPPPGCPDDARIKDVTLSTLHDIPLLTALLEQENSFFLEGRVGIHLSPRHQQQSPDLAAAAALAVLTHTRGVLSRAALRATRGWHMLANTLVNLPRLSREHCLDELRGAAAGATVVIVGAGPSLDRTAPRLAALRDRRPILIACDGAWASLARHGIVPDYVVSIDDSNRIWRFFAALRPPHDRVPVVCMLHSNWPVMRHHQAPLYVGRHNRPTDHIIAASFPYFPIFDSGLCVGHAALELACLMDAKRIVMTGFDLGSDSGLFHPKDHPVPYFTDTPPTGSNVMTVPGNRGPIVTDISLSLYLHEFERRISRLPMPVWNATDGGAVIQGTRFTTLEEAIPPSSSAKRHQPTSATRDTLDSFSAFAAQWSPRLRALLDDLMPAITGLAANPGLWLAQEAAPNPFPFLTRHQAALDFISSADNPMETAAFRFAWEDWVQSGAPAAELPRLASQAADILSSLASTTRLALESLAIAQHQQPACGTTCLAVSRGSQLPASWNTFCRQLTETCGLTLKPLLDDPDDIPAVWAQLRTQDIRIVAMLDGALFPDAWGMPGCNCLDLRTSPPGQILREQLLPGYTVICPTDELADTWRKALPPDRPVVSLTSANFQQRMASGLLHGITEDKGDA